MAIVNKCCLHDGLLVRCRVQSTIYLILVLRSEDLKMEWEEDKTEVFHLTADTYPSETPK